MDSDGAEQKSLVRAAESPVAPSAGARQSRPPPVVDAEFKVLPPVWRLWRALRDSWWALGPYLGYCTALWGLAALVGWLMDRGRAG